MGHSSHLGLETEKSQYFTLVSMALSAEHLLALSLLKGVGVKTVLKFAFQVPEPVSTIEELCQSWQGFSGKGKRLESISRDDILAAGRMARDLIDRSEAASIGLVGYFDDAFPDRLRHAIGEEGKPEPPLFLWYRGDLAIAHLPGVAVIGTREALPEGMAGGCYLSGELARRGFNIISGLALGCDTSGHTGALKAGGKTCAFLANGLDNASIYPPENRALAEEIAAKGGLLLSEYPLGQTVNRYALVARDRLQAALAEATIVVHTGIKGGTMHAANTTLKAGKPLFVMRFKGEATNLHEKCLGNALLVEKGARYISGGDDLDKVAEEIRDWKPQGKGLFD